MATERDTNEMKRDEASGGASLNGEKWQKMGMSNSLTGRVSEYFQSLTIKISGDLEGEDLIRVIWLSCTLFFIVGGYWLLRSLKDPIMSVISGVSNKNYIKRLFVF